MQAILIHLLKTPSVKPLSRTMRRKHVHMTSEAFISQELPIISSQTSRYSTTRHTNTCQWTVSEHKHSRLYLGVSNGSSGYRIRATVPCICLRALSAASGLVLPRGRYDNEPDWTVETRALSNPMQRKIK